MFAQGQSVPLSYIHAYAWIDMPASPGYAPAQKNRAQLLQILSPGQLAQARELAAGYLLLFVAPLASIAYALFRFTGPKLLHVTQLANLWGMFYAAFIGGMAITGDWL